MRQEPAPLVMTHGGPTASSLQHLDERLGAGYARLRRGLESDHHQDVLRYPGKLLHLENWYSAHALIRLCLKVSLLYWRGRRNAAAIQRRDNRIALARLPAAFHGLRILQLSDLHLDSHPDTLHTLIERCREVDYDLCVLTGDYRGKTHGDIAPTLQALGALRTHLKDPVYAVLGNHDSIDMLPGMEDMGIRVLVNESVALERAGERVFLAGVDDPHYFRMDNIEKACADIPAQACKLLLSHTPEIYRQAAHADFDLFLCGHTHGGQICLPGGIPLILEARCPRRLGRGPWQHRQMRGYTSAGAGTSIVEVRLNCPPEITLHTLEREASRP